MAEVPRGPLPPRHFAGPPWRPHSSRSESSTSICWTKKRVNDKPAQWNVANSSHPLWMPRVLTNVPPRPGEEAASHAGKGAGFDRARPGLTLTLASRASQVFRPRQSLCAPGPSLQMVLPFLILAALRVLTSPLSQEPLLPEIWSGNYRGRKIEMQKKKKKKKVRPSS